MSNFGICVNYSPVHNMRNQGLTRLLAELISHMKKHENIYLLIPEWSIEDFKLLLAEHGYTSNKINFITIRSNFLLRLLSLLSRSKQKKKLALQVNDFSNKKSFFIIFNKNIVLNLFKILAIPFAFLINTFSNVFRKRELLSYSDLNVSKLAINYKKILKNTIHLPKRLLRKYALKMTTVYMTNLIAYGNSINQIDTWLIPAPVFPEVELLDKPFLLVIPDLVYIDFPFQFASEAFFGIDNIIKNLSVKAAAIATYSSYVANNHVFNYLNYKYKPIYKIFNAGISSIQHLSNANIQIVDIQDLRQKALHKLNIFLHSNFKKSQWLSFAESIKTKKIVFASTQYRPHKNLINLFRAIKFLNNQQDEYILILTADIFNNNFLKNYIEKNNMKYFIYSFFDISAEILACLNCVSDVSVFPTLSEGGFPFFSFYEAYTVGTPCLLSITPVSQEIKFSSETTNRTYFKPFDIHEMAEKIQWAAKNKQELYNLQMEIYKKLAGRTWDEVAREYLNALESIKI